jgi:hypothetical protein
MKKYIALFLVAFSFNSANAASPNLIVNDFNSDSLSNCVDGNDLGKKLGVANPLTLIGSVGFTTKNADGSIKLNRQPMALPTVISEAGSPDQTTCSITMRAIADGSLNILGIGAMAKKDELYSITGRLLTRQSLATVVENQQNMPIIESSMYKSRFRNVIAGRPAAKDWFLVDNINVYLIEVDRYRKVEGGITGVVAMFSGAGAYKKDETFKGARLLVTGDTIPLDLTMFTGSTDTVIVAPLPASDVLSTLSTTAASNLSAALKANSLRDQ